MPSAQRSQPGRLGIGQTRVDRRESARCRLPPFDFRLSTFLDILPYSNTLPEGSVFERRSHAASHPLN
jgi:hypothetical protein